MKKVLSIILVIIVLFSMVGCRKMEEGEVRNESTVEDFAEAAGVSLEFAQSLNDAVGQIHEKFNRTFDISDVYNFRATDDWANGKRCSPLYRLALYLLPSAEELKVERGAEANHEAT